MAKDEVLKAAYEGVKMAKSFCDNVEFSPEDASRTDHGFLTEVVNAAIEAGATTINVPDTVGYTIPYEFGELFKHLISNCTMQRMLFSVFTVTMTLVFQLQIAWQLLSLEQDKLNVQ